MLSSNNLYLYVKENSIKYKYKESEEEIKTSSINKYKIVNIKEFIKVLKQIIKQNKINKKIISDKVILISITETHLEKIILKEIFTNLDFKKIAIVDINKILDDKEYIIMGETHFVDLNNKNNIKLNSELKSNKKYYVIGNYESKIPKKSYYIYTPFDYIIKRCIDKKLYM